MYKLESRGPNMQPWGIPKKEIKLNKGRRYTT